MAIVTTSLLSFIHEQLFTFASGNSFGELFQAVFGVSEQAHAVEELKQQWQGRDFRQLPTIRVLSTEAMEGASAAYSSETNQIYLSPSLLATASSATLSRILLEEIGHSVDARFNAKDAPGDEGEMFANAILGIQLTPDEKRRIATEQDEGFININNRRLFIEKADQVILNVSTTIDENDGSDMIGAGLSLRDAILIANKNPATDYEIRLTGGQTYPLRASGFHEDKSMKGDLDILSRTGLLQLVAIGSQSAVIDASDLAIGDRIFDVLANGNLSINNLILTGGNCGSNGGAIQVETGSTFSAFNTTIRGNSSTGEGGAIYNDGTCRLERVSIQANKANSFSTGKGGGIWNGGELLLLNSSVTNNNQEGIVNHESLILINTTVSRNQRAGVKLNGASAGCVNSTISSNGEKGIDLFNSSLTLTNCTVTKNAGGIESSWGGHVFLRNTIVAGNNNGGSNSLDLDGEFHGNNHNLIGSLNGARGTVGTGTDLINPLPGLSDLQDNGGLVPTHGLITGSPAINAGNNSLVILDDEDLDGDGNTVERIPFDARGPGFDRIRNGLVDIGAVEATWPSDERPVISLDLSPQSVPEDGQAGLVFRFTRTGATTNPQDVTFTVAGTATAGSDFKGVASGAASKTITIPAGSDTASIVIQPTADASKEANESVSLQVLASATYVIGSSTPVTGSILNDDFIGTATADVITGSSFADNLDGLAGADVLTGGAGDDRFRFRFSQSSLTAPDRITDFAIGADKLRALNTSGLPLPLPTSASRAANNATATTLEQLATAVFADANGALPRNQSLGANRAALVVASHPAIAGTYILLNDTSPNLSARTDTMVNITGWSGALPALGAFAPNLLFA
jgi:predicted outer membrane repeat protein